MGLTIEINSTEDMCRLMCDNEIPMRKECKKMTFSEMERHYSDRYGICIYQKVCKKDGRKHFYKIVYPVFYQGEDLPARCNEQIEATPKDAMRFVEKLLADNEYKQRCEYWVTHY